MNKPQTHTLSEHRINKIISITLAETKLIIEIDTGGKTKKTEKEYLTEEEAKKHFEKKEWEILKKGFVLKNENASLGNPQLHYFVGSGYTGCLSFEGTPNGIYIYKHGWFKAPDDQKDFLVRIDKDGNKTEEIELPRILAWDIKFNISSNSLLLNIDHFIFEYHIESQKFIQLTTEFRRSASFIAVSKNRIAYATSPQLTIATQEGAILVQQSFDVKIINGSIPFCANLSKAGDILAFHNQIEEIQLMDTKDGKLLSTITGNFQRVGQMEFVCNDTVLMAREDYGTGKVLFFDLKNNKELHFPEISIPSHSKTINYFCLNEEESKLVFVQRNHAYVFDFIDKKFLHSFKIEHCVKTARPQFIGNLLGIRTDYGCFSLYTV